MKNLEKHIDNIVSKVLQEQVAFKAEQIMSAANEELHGGQKKLDKNKNGKIDADDFKMLRKDKKEKTEEEERKEKKINENDNNNNIKSSAKKPNED